MTIAIGNEDILEDYCKQKNIKLFDLPENLMHTDRKNPGYHFVYERDIFNLIDSIDFPERPIAVLGSGNFHYISHAILRRIIDKKYSGYTLINIDNHSDTEDIRITESKGRYPLNCATHVRETLRKCKAVEVVHIYKKTDVLQVDTYDKKLSKHESDVRDAVSLSEDLFDPVYISIDIDALSKDEIIVEDHYVFDQGNMKLSELLNILKEIISKHNVIGVDICGMSPDKRSKVIYDSLLDVLNRKL